MTKEEEFNYYADKMINVVPKENRIEIGILLAATGSEELFELTKEQIKTGAFKNIPDLPFSLLEDLLFHYQLKTVDNEIFIVAEQQPFDLYLNPKILWVYKLGIPIIIEEESSILRKP